MAERKNLGRGLSALLGEDDDDDITVAAASGDGPTTTPSPTPSPTSPLADASRGGIHEVPIEHLHPGKYQPRHAMAEAELKELAQSIADKGILQPLLVRPHPVHEAQFEIIAGERRWRAAQLAQVHQVPVLVRALNDQETLEVALVENLQRQDLSPLEEADGYQRLMDEFNHTQEVLSDVIGKSRSHVANMLRLLTLPDGVKALLDKGELSAGHARALIGAADPVALAKKVVKKGLSVRQTEQLVKKEKGGGSGGGKGSAGKTADTLALERDLANLLGLRVEIKGAGQKGVISFHYDNLDQLDNLLHRITTGKAPFEPMVKPLDDSASRDEASDD